MVDEQETPNTDELVIDQELLVLGEILFSIIRKQVVKAQNPHEDTCYDQITTNPTHQE